MQEIQLSNTEKIIQKREEWLITNHLDAGQQKLVKIFEQPTARDVDSPALKKIIDGSITTALQDLGKSGIEKEEDVEYMVEGIYLFVMDRYPSIRINEIKIAFQRGVSGDYGKYYGFNTVALKFFITQHMADAIRAQAMQKFMELKHQASVKPEPTAEEKQALAIHVIFNAFDKFKLKGWYDDFNNVVFSAILSRNPEAFNFTDEEIIGFYKKAKERVLLSYINDTGLTFFEGRNKKVRIKELVAINKFSLALKDPEIASEANRVALNHSFKALVDAGKEVDSLWL